MARRTYGIFWRWHFLAGAIASPLLAIVALTGALYAFQPEIERALQSSLAVVEPHGRPQALGEIERALPAGCVARAYFFPGSPDHSWRVVCADDREFAIDPYRVRVLGRWKANGVFAAVRGLHWEMLLGKPGRIAIEWATSWAVMLMLSGAYLWWPRGRSGGAWWPRRGVRRSARQRLADLHAVLGAYALPCLLAIATTGLFMTAWAGEGRWRRLHDNAVEQLYEHPPSSKVVPGAPRISAQQALAASGLLDGAHTVSMLLPTTPEGAFALFGFDERFGKPSLGAMVYVDAYSGARLGELYWRDLSALGKLDRAGYSIHVGALLGLPGRVLACLASLVLAALAVTGPWMWWKRRPRGGLGIPPRAQRVPRALLVAIAALGWLLPTVGWTLIVVLAIELGRWTQRRWLAPRSITTVAQNAASNATSPSTPTW